MAASPVATAADVRAFARAQGVDVGTRGQLSRELIDSFNQGKRGNARYVKPSERK
jgi:hypothetical protein